MGAYDCDCINNLEYDRRERKTQLSQEDATKGATSDLISRIETVEHLRRMLEATVPNTDYDEGYVDGVEFGISTVSTMPTIQPEPPWIPCSERMPEDLAEVITTWVNRDPLPYYEFMRDKPFTAVSVHYKSEWYWYSSTCADYLEEYGRSDRDKVDKSIEIIAWMPLPTPYTK